MGTVCASPLLGGLVDLDVLDDEVAGVEALGVGVGLGVLEEAEKELGGLDGPAGLGDAEGLALGGAADGAGVAAEGDGLLLLGDVLEEGDGALELPAVDGLGGLTGVLEGHTEVGTARAGRLRGGDLLSGVANLKYDDEGQSFGFWDITSMHVPMCSRMFLIPPLGRPS